MHDSGKRQEFESGAVRDSADGKPRPDLQSPYAQERIGHWLRLGAEKYAERNWEAGMSFSRCVASIERHLVAFKMGKRDEDHLAAIAVNAQFLIHFEEMIKVGVLPKSLDDMPHYYRKIAQIAIESGLKQKQHYASQPTSCGCAGKPNKLTADTLEKSETGKDLHTVSNVDEMIAELTKDGPQFKAGDKVRIKLKRNASAMAYFCAEYNYEGIYDRQSSSETHVVRFIRGCEYQEYIFRTDELTLVEDS